MTTEQENTPEAKFTMEFNNDGECFLVYGPSRPYRTGGTVMDGVCAFGEEGDAQGLVNNLNDWYRNQVLPLRAENERLRKALEEIRAIKMEWDGDVRDDRIRARDLAIQFCQDIADAALLPTKNPEQ